MTLSLPWLGLTLTLAGHDQLHHPHPRPVPPPLPQLPAERTCAAGSPAALLPFCDQHKSHAARAALLAAELTRDERVTLWALHSYHCEHYTRLWRGGAVTPSSCFSSTSRNDD